MHKVSCIALQEGLRLSYELSCSLPLASEASENAGLREPGKGAYPPDMASMVVALGLRPRSESMWFSELSCVFTVHKD